MKLEQQQELHSHRQLHHQQIGTEIMDPNMPSQVQFKIKTSSNNPEQDILWNLKNSDQLHLKHFSVKGKNVYSAKPKYLQNQRIKGSVPTISAKAYDQQKSSGLMKLWESVVGYTKKEISIEEGYFYVFSADKGELVRQSAYNLSDLIKMFVDSEEKSVRLVFKDEFRPNCRFFKNYQIQNTASFIERIVLAGATIGLQITEDAI